MTGRRYEHRWTVDEQGKRTDPYGRFLEDLTPEQRNAWGATCSEDAPRLVKDGDGFRVEYPWERKVGR